MTPTSFKAWRQRLNFSKIAAADALGLSKETIANYEKGKRRDTGAKVIIPKTVALACAAVALGIKELA